MKMITNSVLLLMLLTSVNSFAQSEGKPCINGHENVAPDTILIYTLAQPFPSYSLVNQGAAASIHDYYNDTILVNTGLIPGLFSLYALDAPNGNILCTLQVRVDKALPVEMLSFTSNVNRNNAALNWTTLTEVNNSGFNIQRKTENSQWSDAGFVNGNGTSSTQKNYSFNDNGLITGKYAYRLKQIDYNGNYTYYYLGNEVVIGVPERFELSQNYPNPFNPVTRISYEIPTDGNVSLKIFDMSGKEIAKLVNEVKTAGYYSYDLYTSDLTSGVYFYNLTSNNFTATKKMIVIK